MSTQFHEAMGRFRKLPPLVRYGAVLALLIVAFVLVNDYAWATAGRLNAQSDEIAKTLERARATRVSLRRDLESTVIARGPIRLPVDENRGTQAMADAVNEIVRARSGIAGYSYDSGAVTRLAPTALINVLPGNQRGARATGEVRFDATPEDAMSVIAEIESHPAISGISRVQMTRGGQRRVGVALTVETWVTTGTPGDARGRGGL